MKTQTLEPQVKNALDDTSNCYQACVLTMMYCAQMGGEHAEPKHLSTLLDCAEICELTEHFILRQPESNDYIKDLAETCARICDICAENCEKIGSADEQMKACAEMCRKCAESCRSLNPVESPTPTSA